MILTQTVTGQRLGHWTSGVVIIVIVVVIVVVIARWREGTVNTEIIGKSEEFTRLASALRVTRIVEAVQTHRVSIDEE